MAYPDPIVDELWASRTPEEQELLSVEWMLAETTDALAGWQKLLDEGRRPKRAAWMVAQLTRSKAEWTEKLTALRQMRS